MENNITSYYDIHSNSLSMPWACQEKAPLYSEIQCTRIQLRRLRAPAFWAAPGRVGETSKTHTCSAPVTDCFTGTIDRRFDMKYALTSLVSAAAIFAFSFAM